MTIKANVIHTGGASAHAAAIVGGVNTTTAAAGSNQATATLLQIGSNFVISTGTGGVILPPGNGTADGLTEGDRVTVANYTGSSINVYPPGAGKIANGSASAAFAVGNTKSAIFICIDGTNFFANLSA